MPRLQRQALLLEIGHRMRGLMVVPIFRVYYHDFGNTPVRCYQSEGLNETYSFCPGEELYLHAPILRGHKAPERGTAS